MRRAVYLDRDGVLNSPVVVAGHPFPPSGPQDLEVLPGVREACLQLTAAGFLLVVVTNQPDVARGTQRREVVEEMNETLRQLLRLDDVRVCYHDDADRCPCRKPQPGMILEAAEQLGIDLSSSYFVGDRWRDIEAGRRAGCCTLLLERDYDEPMISSPHRTFSGLPGAVAWILDHETESKQ